MIPHEELIINEELNNFLNNTLNNSRDSEGGDYDYMQVFENNPELWFTWSLHGEPWELNRFKKPCIRWVNAEMIFENDGNGGVRRRLDIGPAFDFLVIHPTFQTSNTNNLHFYNTKYYWFLDRLVPTDPNREVIRIPFRTTTVHVVSRIWRYTVWLHPFLENYR